MFWTLVAMHSAKNPYFSAFLEICHLSTIIAILLLSTITIFESLKQRRSRDQAKFEGSKELIEK